MPDICKVRLEIGENFYTNENKTEKIFLEQSRSERKLESNKKNLVFRIIPQTNYFEGEGQATIRINLKAKLNFNIAVYLTSLENSLGFLYNKWNDGEQLKYTIDKNTLKSVTIRHRIQNFGRRLGDFCKYILI